MGSFPIQCFAAFNTDGTIIPVRMKFQKADDVLSYDLHSPVAVSNAANRANIIFEATIVDDNYDKKVKLRYNIGEHRWFCEY